MKKKWAYEACKEEAKKYNSKSEFQKGNGGAYSVSRKNGWINEWFTNKINPNNTWTYDKCKEEALKYSTIKEFRNKAPVAYGVSCKNKWNKDFIWLKNSPKGNRKWTKENCYNLALKCNTRAQLQKLSSKAYEAAKRNGWFSDYTWFLTEKEARKLSSKGKNLKWTKEKCYEEAKKYSCKQEFHKGSSGAYTSALNNGWLREYDWFKTPSPHNSNKEFSIYAYEDSENNSVYVGLSNCIRRRHRQHIVGHMDHGVRTFDTVHKYFESVGKDIPSPIIKIKGLNEEEAQDFEDFYKVEYANNGWNIINKGKTGKNISSIGYRKVIWTKEKCYETAMKYSTIYDFQKNDVTAYNKAHKMGWFSDYTWLDRLSIEHGFYNDYNKCYDEARKYSSKTEFRNSCGSAYTWALNNGWISDYTWFAKKDNLIRETKRKITYEKCYDVAKSFDTIKEFRENKSGYYTTALKNGWFSDYTWLKRGSKKKWTYDTCKEVAVKCISRGDFKKINESAYAVARKKGWLQDFFPSKALA